MRPIFCDGPDLVVAEREVCRCSNVCRRAAEKIALLVFKSVPVAFHLSVTVHAELKVRGDNNKHAPC